MKGLHPLRGGDSNQNQKGQSMSNVITFASKAAEKPKAPEYPGGPKQPHVDHLSAMATGEQKKELAQIIAKCCGMDWGPDRINECDWIDMEIQIT